MYTFEGRPKRDSITPTRREGSHNFFAPGVTLPTIHFASVFGLFVCKGRRRSPETIGADFGVGRGPLTPLDPTSSSLPACCVPSLRDSWIRCFHQTRHHSWRLVASGRETRIRAIRGIIIDLRGTLCLANSCIITNWSTLHLRLIHSARTRGILQHLKDSWRTSRDTRQIIGWHN